MTETGGKEQDTHKR